MENEKQNENDEERENEMVFVDNNSSKLRVYGNTLIQSKTYRTKSIRKEFI